MIGATVTMRVNPGKIGEFERLYRQLAEQVRSREEGNFQYELFRSADDPNTYKTMEQYRDHAAIEAHLRTEHIKRLGPALSALLVEEPVIEIVGDKVVFKQGGR
jgi:quinol monooxygenase YgiN